MKLRTTPPPPNGGSELEDDLHAILVGNVSFRQAYIPLLSIHDGGTQY
jgi:hypothetical protein